MLLPSPFHLRRCYLPESGKVSRWRSKEMIPDNLILVFSPHNAKGFLFLFFFLRLILMWTILKYFLNLLQYCFWDFFFFFWPWGMWDLSSPARDWTCSPCIGRQSLHHWTAREVPKLPFKDHNGGEEKGILPCHLKVKKLNFIWQVLCLEQRKTVAFRKAITKGPSSQAPD